MPRLNRIRATIIGLVGATALIAVPLSQAAEAASTNQAKERSIFDLTNKKRAKVDAASLKGSKCVDGFAERHAKKMAAEQKMYHQDLGPILEACDLNMVGENVAYGYPTGKAAMQGWMNSPGHRANILNKDYRVIGVAAYEAKNGAWYYAQVFGRQA